MRNQPFRYSKAGLPGSAVSTIFLEIAAPSLSARESASSTMSTSTSWRLSDFLRYGRSSKRTSFSEKGRDLLKAAVAPN